MLQILLLFIPSIDFLPETNNPVLLYNSTNINIINKVSELSNDHTDLVINFSKWLIITFSFT